MKFKLVSLVLATAFALPLIPNTAFAYEKCMGLEEKDFEKCEKKEAKRIGKLRSSTTAFVPSALGDGFSGLDATNPFDSDDWYLGTVETGIEKVDVVINEVVKVQAAVKMAKYVSWEFNNGDKDKATSYAKPTLDALMNLQNAQADIQGKVDELKSTPPTELVDDPSQALKAIGAVKNLVSVGAQIPSTFADIPGAITSVKPIAAGMGGDAVENAAEAVQGAMP
jgi:hypothetical protein